MMRNLWRKIMRAWRRLRYRAILPRQRPQLDRPIKHRPHNCPLCSGRIVLVEGVQDICAGKRETVQVENGQRTAVTPPCGWTGEGLRCPVWASETTTVRAGYYCAGLADLDEARAFLADELPGGKLVAIALPRRPCGWTDTIENFGRTWL